MNNSLWNNFKGKYRLNRNRINKNGRKIITTTLLISAIAGLGYREYDLSTRGVNVVYGEKNIGVVRNQKEVDEIVKDLETNLSKDLNKNIKLDKQVSFVKTHVKDKDLTKKADITQSIKSDLSYSAVAYAIKIDDKEVAYLDSKEEAKQALEEYKGSVVESIDDHSSEIKSVEVLENVSLVKKQVPVEQVNDVDTTVSKIQTGSIEEQTCTLGEEESITTLAENYNVPVEEIEKLNPEKDTQALKAGDQVVVPVAKPLLTVATYEEKKVEEEIEFETEYEIDENLYKDKEEVRIDGEKGKVEKDVKIEKHNGVEIAEQVLGQSIIKEPTKEVIAKGTKPMPLTLATGTFSMPTRGTITSPFGHRWGKNHGGIDIGARIGEPINVADGGTVVRSEFNQGGYGYMVDVDHGNGYVTRYAHCSQLFVNIGDKVAKGDVIAAVGNTGRSTGPHLHFEVRKDGVPQDPQGYLN